MSEYRIVKETTRGGAVEYKVQKQISPFWYTDEVFSYEHQAKDHIQQMLDSVIVDKTVIYTTQGDSDEDNQGT